MKNYQIEGVNFWDQIYQNPSFVNDKGVSLIIADGDAKATMSAKTLSKYVRPYQIRRLTTFSIMVTPSIRHTTCLHSLIRRCSSVLLMVTQRTLICTRISTGQLRQMVKLSSKFMLNKV